VSAALAARGWTAGCTSVAWYQGRPPRIPRPFSRASGTEKPTRSRSNAMEVPFGIEAHGSVPGPVTVTAMTSLTGFMPGSG